MNDETYVLLQTSTDPNPTGDEAEPLEDDHYPDDDDFEEISDDEL